MAAITFNTQNKYPTEVGMLIAERFKFLHKLFKFVGFAPINIKRKDQKINNLIDNIVNLIPTTLATILSFSVSYFLLVHPHFESYGPIHGIINLASLSSLLLIVITGNCQSFFKRSTHRKMVQKITQIEQKMFAEVPIESPFVNVCKLKIFSIFFLFFLSQGLVFYEASLASSAGMLSSFFTSLFRFIFPTAVSHVILYSGAVSNFLYCLNAKIGNTSTSLHQAGSKVELLRNIKLIHMDVWKVLVQINRYFGWNLFFLVINSFVYITYQLYWIFVTLEKQWDKLGVIEGAVSLSYGIVSLYILVSSCQSCCLEVQHLAESIEHFVFWSVDNEKLHTLKMEIFHQINNLSMNITACDFFCLDRRLLGSVLTSCSLYIVTFIQFFIAAETKS